MKLISWRKISSSRYKMARTVSWGIIRDAERGIQLPVQNLIWHSILKPMKGIVYDSVESTK